MKRFLFFSLLYCLFCSHELFLKTDNYFLEPNEEAELYLFNGSFDLSENTITRDRIQNAHLIGGGENRIPEESDYFDRNDATFLKIETGAPGTYLAGISTRPRMIDLDAKSFREYLEHEGLHDMIEEREEKGLQNESAREKYSKHVKSIIQVGDQYSMDYSNDLDFPIEFVALDNPYERQVGDELSFQLLYRGQPLGGEVVRSGYRLEGDTHFNGSVRTDDEGKCRIKLTSKGSWYIASIHIHESDEGEIDYESNWATLTFGVK